MSTSAQHHYERTAVGPNSRWQPEEVYYRTDPDGTATDAYTFRDSEAVRKTRHVTTWLPARNPLFVHASRPGALMTFLDSAGWILED